MDDPWVAQLRRWEAAGGRWRVLARDDDAAVVALLTCDAGEEVGRVSGGGPALMGYLCGRDESDDDGDGAGL